MSTSLSTVHFNKVMKKFNELTERMRKKSDRELEQKLGKEEFIKILQKRAEMEKTMKRIRAPKVDLDEEEENEIRRILMSKIRLFREKLRREPYR